MVGSSSDIVASTLSLRKVIFIGSYLIFLDLLAGPPPILLSSMSTTAPLSYSVVVNFITVGLSAVIDLRLPALPLLFFIK